MAEIYVQKFTFRAVIQPDTDTPVQYEKVENKTTYNESTKLYTTTVVLRTKDGKDYTGTGSSTNPAESMQVADDEAFNKLNENRSGTIVVSTYGDNVYIRQDKYATTTFTIQSALRLTDGKTIFGIYDMSNTNYYVLAPDTPPPPPPPPTPPSVEPQKVYYPKTRYTEPKSATPGEFVVKNTQEEYKGTYVETFNSKYFGGSSPLDTGVELEKVKEPQARLDEGLPNYFGILAEVGGSILKRLLTKAEKSKGVIKRYFVQDKNNNKIVETDKPNYLQTQQQVMSRRFLEVDWVIKGPADDRVFGAYKYEGAASKNKKTIQALEKQMPGISTFITDYSYLVEQPEVVVAAQQSLTTQTIVEKDADTSLENSRKANFDTRK
jgi:hypothetical protein